MCLNQVLQSRHLDVLHQDSTTAQPHSSPPGIFTLIGLNRKLNPISGKLDSRREALLEITPKSLVSHADTT